MITVAVTGGAGSGKSTACRAFKDLGAHVVDLDQLARRAVEPGSAVLDNIVHAFGNAVLRSDGTLDRAAMRRLVLRDAGARARLERITHPEIFRRLDEAFGEISRQDPHGVVVVEVPLLFEVGAQDRFDVVVLVDADPTERARRIVVRDGVAAAEAEALIGIQGSSLEKRTRADHVVDNQGPVEDLRLIIQKIYDEIVRGKIPVTGKKLDIEDRLP